MANEEYKQFPSHELMADQAGIEGDKLDICFSDAEEEEEEEKNIAITEEGMACDLSSYEIFHEGDIGYSCLSFDILRDTDMKPTSEGEPVKCCFVAGSQADVPHANVISLVYMENITRLSHNDGKDDIPVLQSASSKHSGCVNRIRATFISGVPVASTWSEFGHVYIWDLSDMLSCSKIPGKKRRVIVDSKPVFKFSGHNVEGFAMDWSSITAGTLASGDVEGNIYLWHCTDNSWTVSSNPYTSHTKSVEDIQWSPCEANVFASCSADKSLKIWDARVDPGSACMLSSENAHKADINVIHWNRLQPFLASGSDDKTVRVWDLRKFQGKSPLADLVYHTSGITSIEWNPFDESVLASADDEQILQWDLSVEKDMDAKDVPESYPDQLLFVHKGQQEIKELHWDPYYPGLLLSTALTGFNIFKTISC